jgi:hypothetical protein
MEGHVRFAAMGPSFAATSDLCIALAGTHNYQWQLSTLTGASAGIPYKQVSAYITIPHGSYDVAWTSPAGSCTPTGGSSYPPNSQIAVLDTQIGGAGTESLTFVSYGSVGNVEVGLIPLTDETAAPAGTPSGGSTIRFVNATYAVVSPAVFGSGTLGQPGFAALFSGVSASAGVAPAGAGVDSLGYIQIAPLLDQTFSIGPVGSRPTLTASSYSLPNASLTSHVITVFLTGDESVSIQPADRVAASLVQVDDQATPASGLLPTR